MMQGSGDAVKRRYGKTSTLLFDYGADPECVRSVVEKAHAVNSDNRHISEEPVKVLVVRPERALRSGSRFIKNVFTGWVTLYSDSFSSGSTDDRQSADGHFTDDYVDDEEYVDRSFEETETSSAFVVESLHVNREIVQYYHEVWHSQPAEERADNFLIVTSVPEHVQSLYKIYEYSMIIAPYDFFSDFFSADFCEEEMDSEGVYVEIPVMDIALADSHEEFMSINDDGELLVAQVRDMMSASETDDRGADDREQRERREQYRMQRNRFSDPIFYEGTMRDFFLFLGNLLGRDDYGAADPRDVVYDPREEREKRRSRRQRKQERQVAKQRKQEKKRSGKLQAQKSTQNSEETAQNSEGTENSVSTTEHSQNTENSENTAQSTEEARRKRRRQF